LKKRRPCVLLNILIVAISVGLPVTVNTRVPASRVGFQQFRAIQHFCVEGSNKHSDRGHSSNELEVLLQTAFSEGRFLILANKFNAFHFFPRNS